MDSHIRQTPLKKPAVAIPKPSPSRPPPSPRPLSPPKTPADEGIEFFQSNIAHPDGAPHKDHSVYTRLPPAYSPYILRVSIDAGTPASKNGVFKTNFPLDGGKFGRNKFTERKLPTDFSKPILVDLPISHAGAFVFWVEHDGDTPGERIKGCEGYFNIDPILRIKSRSPILNDGKPTSVTTIGADLVNLPMDGLSILTVVSKWMGPVSESPKFFDEAKDRGYTMLHYPPLQERGHSDSPYSIRDQLKYDPAMFGDGCKEDGKAQVEAILKVAREQGGLLSLTDVVLNHTADDSSWLVKHPEAGFSPANSPHLTPAHELDSAIINLSGDLASKNLPTVVTSTDDLDLLVGAVQGVVNNLNLWQLLSSNKIIAWDGPVVAHRTVIEIAEILRASGKIHGLGKYASRFGVSVDPGVAAGLVKAAFVEVSEISSLVDAWARVIDVVNVPLYEECNEDVRAAVDNIKNRMKYTRLDEHGPKLGSISKSSPLVKPYFTRLTSSAVNADPLVYSLANNGWIWNADPLKNFAELPSKSYMRREVIVWGDCVKLRYGSGPSDNPWSHMTAYVESLAATFDGFRIDNCHSTPLHVARVVNPNLYVCAELFTGNEEMDTVFVKRLGINSLIRESGNAWDPKELSRLIYRHGVGKPIRSMDAALTRTEEIPSPTGKGPVRSCTSYSGSAIGSVKGFDDLYPKLLNLVGEKRQYELTGLRQNSGIARMKHTLNGLHMEMVRGGFTEGHVHQENDYIVVHRVQPETQKGYLLVAHCAFTKGSKDRRSINPLKLRRTSTKFILGSTLEFSSYNAPEDSKTLRGMDAKLVDMATVVVPQGLDGEGPYSEIVVPEVFPSRHYNAVRQYHDASLDVFCTSGAKEAFADLDRVDLRADGEERDATSSEFGVYNVLGLGKMAYCGLEGWMHPLHCIMRPNDLGHALWGHLREGSWALDYVHQRLFKQSATLPRLAKAAEWFKERFDRVQANVPPHLRPKYFARRTRLRTPLIEQSSSFVSSGHSFTQDLAMCSVQMHGLVQSASLDPSASTPSLAAGLPHFTAGWARRWGRDGFISLRGLFLTTGNFVGAKRHILAFTSTLKHGLIPNLLDSVRNPRYNSRDWPWWMLQNIQDYVNYAPDGLVILSEPVKRRFPKDVTWVPWNDPAAYAYSTTVVEIIQEILQRHADGIHCREYNAGPNLDMQMKDNGFICRLDDWDNWGTSMDKMGESVIPWACLELPRDGAPVESTSLLKSTWLEQLSGSGKFPFKGVRVKATIEGQERLASFEKCYYVPVELSQDSNYNVDSKPVNRRGIYKDVYGSGAGRDWLDYQLRCNLPVAMTVAPELFDVHHAMRALKIADKVLRGLLGMKTLGPLHQQYRPNYDNSNDSSDASIAKGLNYHNGL
ncbi:glycoside hydrolase family 13 protein [Mycena amicta]|nr:glycoside hydrolase family 13 protein [Mycena amicta]